MNRIRASASMLVVLLVLAGCHSPFHMRSFNHPDADYDFYQRVGTLPFQSEADDRLAGEKVTEDFVTELLIHGGLQVMDPGQFKAEVAKIAGMPNPAVPVDYSPEQLKRIGEEARVQGIFMGTVHEYSMMQVGGERYPILSMTVKFVDAPTGTVVWQSNVTSRGGPNVPLLSVGESFVMGELTQKVCRKVVDDFFRKAGIR